MFIRVGTIIQLAKDGNKVPDVLWAEMQEQELEEVEKT
jgi:hypothetical protein